MSLTLEIVTPEARVYSDTIDTVVIPTVDGEIGILPGHIPLLTQVADGELRVTKGGIAYISSGVTGGQDIDGLLFRLETWAKGSGYVGRVAASDEVWVMQIFNALKENWPNPPFDYIDVY